VRARRITEEKAISRSYALDLAGISTEGANDLGCNARILDDRGVVMDSRCDAVVMEAVLSPAAAASHQSKDAEAVFKRLGRD
jgi:hypothetical protein